jgi:arginyl-tRNA synthetase
MAPLADPHDLVAHLQRAILAALGAGGEGLRAAITLQPPKNREHGDLALPCFLLGKALGQPPPAVGKLLGSKLGPDDVLESVTVAGPFVNFRWRRAALARSVVEGVLGQRPPYGPWPKSGRSIVIDFSSPNIAKPFHLGHLRSTMIGAALRRMHRHCGNDVHGVNHLGDWGAQFGKIITAWRRWGSEAELRRDPMRHLFEVYVRYGMEAKAGPALDEESARNFQQLEAGVDNDERRLWKKLRDVSLLAFEGVYRRLGVEFDHVLGESFYEDKMAGAIERLRAAGVTSESEGALVVDLAADKMPPCILVKSDGTTIYATRDLAAIFYRAEAWRFDRALYVVGTEQKLHFQQLRAVLRRLRSPLADRIEHVDFGLVLAQNEQSGRWEKFTTRGGNAVFLEEVLDEAVKKAKAVVLEKAKVEPGDADAVAEQVGVSAIVFNDLKNSRIKDVKFDWDAMLSFDGESGPYVQYAVARLSAILRKAAAEDANDQEAVDWSLLADAEHPLLSMLEFGPTLQRALEQSEPSVLTSLLLQIAGDVHGYLKEHHVLRAEPALRRARLQLVRAARDLLRAGLALLGVATPERM